MARLIIFVFPFVAVLQLRGQSDPDRYQDELLGERILERVSEDAEDSPMMEELDALERNPLNLNTATIEEISGLPFLSPAAASALHAAREDLGGFDEWEQVASIAGIDEDAMIYLRLYTYIPVRGAVPVKSTVQIRSRFQAEDQPRKGFLDGRYPGTRWKSLHRINASISPHLHGGLLIEKDPGEISFFDHVTGYAGLDSLGMVERIIVGDFTVNAGQGLVLWKSAGFSKGGDAARAGYRSAPLLQPSLSAGEYGALRGVAAQLRVGGARLAAFVSMKSLDARIDSATGAVSSFDESGLHRTLSELSKSNAVGERSAGGHAELRTSGKGWRLDAGLTGVVSRLDRRVASETPFSFSGTEAVAFGTDAQLRLSSMTVFTEWARTHNRGIGGIVGLSARAAESMVITVIGRAYAPEFVSRFGYAFGERNGATQNEQGVYLGIRCAPVRGVTAQASFDAYRFPGRTYTYPVPASGHDMQFDADWRASKRFLVGFRYGQDVKDDVVSALDQDGRAIRPVTQRTRRQVRVDCRYEASRAVSFRTRIEAVFVSHSAFVQPETGALISADAQFEPVPTLRISARIASFRSDSWDSRLYQYEPDLRGVMSNAALSGQGVRYSLIAQWTIGKGSVVGIKYGGMIMTAARAIGTGEEEITGDSIGRVSAQMDVIL